MGRRAAAGLVLITALVSCGGGGERAACALPQLRVEPATLEPGSVARVSLVGRLSCDESGQAKSSVLSPGTARIHLAIARGRPPEGAIERSAIVVADWATAAVNVAADKVEAEGRIPSVPGGMYFIFATEREALRSPPFVISE